MNHSAQRIDFLDYARGIAILCVFFYHCLGSAYGIYTLPWHWVTRGFDVPPSFLALLPVHFGFIGVPIFFVVSGFCIHLSFEKQGREWSSFFIRRFFRIYPAYLLAMTLFALIYSRDAHDFWFQFAAHALLIHNYVHGAYYALNGSFWTLAVEMQLYLLYPLLRALVSRIGWNWTLICLAACEILLQGWDGLVNQITIYSGWASPFLLHKITPFVDDYLKVSPVGFWFSWSIGALMADAFLTGRPMPLAKSSVWFWAFLVVASYFMSLFAAFFFLFSAVLTAKVIGQCLAPGASRFSPGNFWLAQLRLVGIWSYSIYLLHQPLVEFLGGALRHSAPGIGPFAVFLCCAGSGLIIIPLAGLWYWACERPGIALGKALIRKMESAPANADRSIS